MFRLRRLRPAAVLILGGLAAAGLTACSGGNDAVDPTANAPFHYTGATAPGTTIPVPQRKAVANTVNAPLLDGTGNFTLSSVQGQIVVLNFWATNCGPCVTETPAFDSIYRSMKADGVTFVGIDVKEVSRSKVKAFVADNSISYPIVYDQTAKTALQLGNVPATNLPSTVVIDRHGRVAAVYVGRVQTADLQPVLTSLAAEQ